MTADPLQTDRFIEDVRRAIHKHADLTVMTGAGGHRRLFPAEADRISRIAARAVGELLASLLDPPEDSMATDEDLTRYEIRGEAAAEIRELTEGAWDR